MHVTILFFKTDVISFPCFNLVSIFFFMVLSSVSVNYLYFVQTFKTSKQQRQATKTIPVTIANVESTSKEIMGKIGILNL